MKDQVDLELEAMLAQVERNRQAEADLREFYGVGLAERNLWEQEAWEESLHSMRGLVVAMGAAVAMLLIGLSVVFLLGGF